MRLTIVESTNGTKREFTGGNENMTVQFFLQKISELYDYDRNRVKVLFNTNVLNKMPSKT